MPTDGSVPPTGDEPDLQPVRLPPWAVVLHNADYITLPYVVTCLVNTVTSLSPERATEITQEVSVQGLARVVTCPLEIAEFYRDRLESLILTATIERA